MICYGTSGRSYAKQVLTDRRRLKPSRGEPRWHKLQTPSNIVKYIVLLWSWYDEGFSLCLNSLCVFPQVLWKSYIWVSLVRYDSGICPCRFRRVARCVWEHSQQWIIFGVIVSVVVTHFRGKDGFIYYVSLLSCCVLFFAFWHYVFFFCICVSLVAGMFTGIRTLDALQEWDKNIVSLPSTYPEVA